MRPAKALASNVWFCGNGDSIESVAISDIFAGNYLGVSSSSGACVSF